MEQEDVWKKLNNGDPFQALGTGTSYLGTEKSVLGIPLAPANSGGMQKRINNETLADGVVFRRASEMEEEQ